MEPVATTEIAYTHTYTMTHPDLTEPLVIDTASERDERIMAGVAMMHILKTFDHMIPVEEWDVSMEVIT